MTTGRHKRDKPPPIMVEIAPQGGLRAVDQYDARRLEQERPGSQYELVPLKRRSWPQLKLYWAILDNVVYATGKWPNSTKLSEDLKFVCGYRSRFTNLITGEIIEQPDSIALDEMGPDTFNQYFEQAMEQLAFHLQIDPMALPSRPRQRRRN